MSSARAFEEISSRIASLNKSELKRRLRSFKGLKLDFTDSYLEGQSVDRLRHILLAAMTTRMHKRGA
jgi:hypothetical protein